MNQVFLILNNELALSPQVQITPGLHKGVSKKSSGEPGKTLTAFKLRSTASCSYSLRNHFSRFEASQSIGDTKGSNHPSQDSTLSPMQNVKFSIET